MKELSGYLIDRATGLGIAGKAVAFKNLAGASFASAASPWVSLDSVTDANGRFRGRWEFSPGPVNIDVTVSGSEVKSRKWDEKAQVGSSWLSDQRIFARAIKNGVIDNYMNELAVSIPAGHTIRIATGAAIVNGNIVSIENGNHDVTGTANSNPALNPRIDLVTLRQYNEDAAGQDAGRQEVVVTLGVASNSAPATPTGATFEDFPLATVSTAYLGATKTIAQDLRVFTGHETPAPLLYDIDEVATWAAAAIPITTAYFTAATPQISGLDPLKTYDGELVIHGNWGQQEVTELKQGQGQDLILKVDSPFMMGGAVIDRIIDYRLWDMDGSGDEYREVKIFHWSSPIIGVTGVSSLSLPIQLKGVVNEYDRLQYIYSYMTLKERR
jgi:hypothetical protein